MLSSDHHDDVSAGQFYSSLLGQTAARVIRQTLHGLWPDAAGLSLLGLGYSAPFLSLWQGQAYACINATSAHHGTPPPGACAVHATQLPFPDLAFDRILLIHGVEPVGLDTRLLREAWRVLKDDGKLLVAAPNRMGLWAHAETTPFGQGQPYSRTQLDRLLASAMFHPERRENVLFTPPIALRPVLNASAFWERLGAALAPELAGVTLTEAVKDTYAALPIAARATRRVVLTEAA